MSYTKILTVSAPLRAGSTAPMTLTHHHAPFVPGETIQLIPGTKYQYAYATEVAAEKAVKLGFNLSGLEAGSGGALGWTHVAPSQTDITLAASCGAKLARIPFKMYRVFVNGALVTDEFAALKTATDRVRAAGMRPLVDEHSYGEQADPALLAQGWAAIANALGNPDDVILGLQNEPHKRGSGWWAFAQEVTTQLRAAGITNWLSVAGSGYSGATNWVRDNGNAVLAFNDPLDRTFFESHLYFDEWSSGTQKVCKLASAARLDGLLSHAQTNGYKVIIGEMAFSEDATCDAVRTEAIAKIKASSAVYGVTFWTLGNFALYPNYMFGLTGKLDETGKQAGKGVPSILLERLLAEWNG